jgi:hypothetical protein
MRLILHVVFGRMYRISRPIRRTVIFSLEILEKNNDEYVLILAIYWTKLDCYIPKLATIMNCQIRK